MKYNFQSVKFNPKDKLSYLVKKKTTKLRIFFKKILSIQVYAKFNNNNKCLNKEVEFIVSLPGEQLIVKKSSRSFETSINLVSSKIERLLKKYKRKIVR
jgi:putative sigma-54 modulation protein